MVFSYLFSSSSTPIPTPKGSCSKGFLWSPSWPWKDEAGHEWLLHFESLWGVPSELDTCASEVSFSHSFWVTEASRETWAAWGRGLNQITYHVTSLEPLTEQPGWLVELTQINWTLIRSEESEGCGCWPHLGCVCLIPASFWSLWSLKGVGLSDETCNKRLSQGSC